MKFNVSFRIVVSLLLAVIMIAGCQQEKQIKYEPNWTSLKQTI